MMATEFKQAKEKFMRKFTLEDMKSFDVIDGVIQCPSGDYSLIKNFTERCSFADECLFTKRCSFAVRCSFAGGCSFAEECSFAARCSFARGCSFAKECSFAGACTFAKRCSFARRCSFAKRCSFAEWCSFAEGCSFSGGCSVCGNELKGFKIRSISGLGKHKRTMYVWDTINGFRVQAGCFFGDVDEFTNSVINKYGANHAYIRAVEFLTSDWG